MPVRIVKAAMRVGAGALLAGMLAVPVVALDTGSLSASAERGFGRLVIAFDNRQDLPAYRASLENGVLSILFDAPVALGTPDIAATLPGLVAQYRLDGAGQSLRIALRPDTGFNVMEAGEQLFVDLLPTGWQGEKPGLPADVVAEMEERARLAAIEAERERRAEGAETLAPSAAVTLLRNASFSRLQFDWSTPTTAAYTQHGTRGELTFEWPVPVALEQVGLDLPAEILELASSVTRDGAKVVLTLAPETTARFYATSDRQQVLDIDTALAPLPALSVEALAQAATEPAPASAEPAAEERVAEPATQVTPDVRLIGDTLRVVFPFDVPVPAAVFERGGALWLFFDSAVALTDPANAELFAGIVTSFEPLPSGDAQVVRLELAADRKVTLGSDGNAWVLSIGDGVLQPSEPIALERRIDRYGLFEMSVDLMRPGHVHEFTDLVVGDELFVVTALPPARGVTREFGYVDFSALRSVHGLVLRAENEDLSVALDGQYAMIGVPEGLMLSSSQRARYGQAVGPSQRRERFVDLSPFVARSAPDYRRRLQTQLATISGLEDGRRDAARLNLARLYIANDFSYEALGVLRASVPQDPVLGGEHRLLSAIASTLAHRSDEALALLEGDALAEDVDALFWRAIARAESGDFVGARQDAIASSGVAPDYPVALRNRFALAATLAAVEIKDRTLAERLLALAEFSEFDEDGRSRHQLLTGRIFELAGRNEEALARYANAITSDVRPVRAEAVMRRTALEMALGSVDPAAAAETLASEVLLWRGDAVETESLALLSALYLDEGRYRDSLETARAASRIEGDERPVRAVQTLAQETFVNLYLEGEADTLGPIEALSLYYDYQDLTPPGARGDEMIRNLARRLVDADLLTQAATLLSYQVEHRLTGAARAQVGAELAVLLLADRQPRAAITVINETRLPNLSAALTSQRRLIEVRALIDAGRHQLALDLLEGLGGREAELLRVDALWRAERYGQAAGLLEAMAAEVGTSGEPPRSERDGLIRAAIGYALAGDRLALARLRDTYGERIVQSPEWAIFDFVSGPVATDSIEFAQVVRQVAGLNGLDAFLARYREQYRDEAPLVPDTPGETASL